MKCCQCLIRTAFFTKQTSLKCVFFNISNWHLTDFCCKPTNNFTEFHCGGLTTYLVLIGNPTTLALSCRSFSQPSSPLSRIVCIDLDVNCLIEEFTVFSALIFFPGFCKASIHDFPAKNSSSIFYSQKSKLCHSA